MPATTRRLRDDVLRFVRMSGRKATPHSVVEGLRNRWQARLESQGDGPYYLQMADLLEDMRGVGELGWDGRRFTPGQGRHPEPKGWISFSWTTPALVNGEKTVTRRDWKDSHASRFSQGDIVKAYDRRPDLGGRPVALIRLTHTPYRQSTERIPPMDWWGEGFAYLQSIGKKVGGKAPRELWDEWKDNPVDVWVIRFDMVELL